MKYLIVMLFVFKSFSIYAQYGIDGGLVAGGLVIAWNAEKKSLETIRDHQNEILIANTTIAVEAQILLDIEKKLYNSLSKVDDLVQNASTIIRIAEHSKELFYIQELTYEAAKDNPYLIAIVAAQEAELLKQSGYLLVDLYIATKEGKVNLMNSYERLDYMNNILTELDKLKVKALQIYRIIKGATVMSNINSLDIEEVILNLDYKSIYNRAHTDYDIIFKQ